MSAERTQRGAFASAASTLGACAFAGAITDVVCVVGVIGNFGTAPLLALWVIDAAIVIAFAGAIAGVVDRVNRTRALLVLLGGTSVLHLVVAALFFANARPAISYGALLALARIDTNLVMTFGLALARDHFDFDSAVKAFTRLNVVAVVAGSVGTIIATRLVTNAARVAGVVGMAVVFALAAVVVWRAAPRGPTGNPPHERISLPPSGPAGAARFSLPPAPLRVSLPAEMPGHATSYVTHREAIQFVMRDSIFRSLAWFGVVNGSAHSVIAYEVLRTFEENDGDLATQYAILRFAEPIALVVVEAIVAPSLIRRVGVRGAFVAPSIAVLVAASVLAVSQRPSLAITSALITNLAFGIEYSGFAATLTEIPDRLRPRTSVLLDGTVYHVGYITGVLVLLLAAGAAKLTQYPGDVARLIALATTFVLSLAGLRLALRFEPQFGRVRSRGSR